MSSSSSSNAALNSAFFPFIECPDKVQLHDIKVDRGTSASAAASGSPRLGVDGEFLIELLLKRIHEDTINGDRYWVFVETYPPSLPGLLTEAVELFLKVFGSVAIVFDGVLPSRTERHVSFAPFVAESSTSDHMRRGIDPIKAINGDQQLAPLLANSCFNATLEPAGHSHVKRLLKREFEGHPHVEIITAPSLAWAQLAAWRIQGSRVVADHVDSSTSHSGAPRGACEVDFVFAPPEALMFPPLSQVIVNVDAADHPPRNFGVVRITRDVDDARKHERAKMGVDPHCVPWQSMYSTNPQQSQVHRCARRLGVNFLDAAAAFECAPVFDGKAVDVKPFYRLRGLSLGMHASPAPTRDLFFLNLGASPLPLTYFLMATGAIDPVCVTTAASALFRDPAPIFGGQDYDVMVQRVMPLRAQIIYQFATACVRSENYTLRWENGPSIIPISQPPEIVLDEWDLSPTPANYGGGGGAGFDFEAVLPRLKDVNLASVILKLSERAKNPTIWFDRDLPFRRRSYDTPAKLLAATLLKSLDLLGYFTHSAGQDPQDDSSTGSVYAAALAQFEHFPEEGVLLIELLRTRTLHGRDANGEASDTAGEPQLRLPAIFLAARILSLVPVHLDKPYQGVVNPFTLTFTLQARFIQQNLRHLHEVMLHNLCVENQPVQQVVRVPYLMNGQASQEGHPPCFPNGLLHCEEVAQGLPFGKPLSAVAGSIAIALITCGILKDQVRPEAMVNSFEVGFPGMDVVGEVLPRMRGFWDCAKQAMELLNVENQEVFPDLSQIPFTLVDQAFDVLGVVPRYA